jgi:hypothetical protein
MYRNRTCCISNRHSIPDRARENENNEQQEYYEETTINPGIDIYPISNPSSDDDDNIFGSLPCDPNQRTPCYGGTETVGVNCIKRNTAEASALGYRHDPDGFTLLSLSDWPSWDGVTTYDPCSLTATELCTAIWPSNTYAMIGLRDLFYSINPFADVSRPTVTEIEKWNLEVINHYRRLLGISPAENDRSLTLQAYWAQERMWSTIWDADYPGTLGTAYGPCVGMSPWNSHCGATFIPSCDDQQPYLNSGESCVTDTSFAEGVFPASNSWPWSVKLSKVLNNIVCSEGITGHGGPFVSRPKFGISFDCTGSATTIRIKWANPNTDPCP